MDFVLGLSMTSTAVRWVLAEGSSGDGAPIDRGAIDTAADAAFDAEDLLDELLDGNVAFGRLRAIGVTWSRQAEAAATAVFDALAARGHDNVLAISDVEAVDALARGIADITDYDDVAVCVVEPDAVLFAAVGASDVTVERSEVHHADPDALAIIAMTVMESACPRPDAVFVLGSDGLEPVVASLSAMCESPVISAAEADLALARGAALASAAALRDLNPAVAQQKRRFSRTGALASVLAAAIVTFVVSLSAALGLELRSDSEQRPVVDASGEAVPAATPSPVKAAPRDARSVAPRESPPRTGETIKVNRPSFPVPEVAADPADDLPAYVPPAPAYVPPAPAYVPPAPAYVPPAPAPAYVPPAPAYVAPEPAYVPPPVAEPRLRDRIIERIPIINRFHEPKPQYPQ